jgi:hypothetical protein
MNPLYCDVVPVVPSIQVARQIIRTSRPTAPNEDDCNIEYAFQPSKMATESSSLRDLRHVPRGKPKTKTLNHFVVHPRHENYVLKAKRRRSINVRMRPILVDLFFLLWCLQSLVPQTESFLPQHNRPSLQFFSIGSVQNLNIVAENQSTNSTQRHYPWPDEACNMDLHSFYTYNPKCHLDLDAWQKLCPKQLYRKNRFGFTRLLVNGNQCQPNPTTRSLDISRFWSLEDDPKQVASEIVRDCLQFDGQDLHLSNEAMERLLSTSLAESLQAYKEFCREHLLRLLPNHSTVRFKCRLVATLGPSGAKCPQYHIDHVPVRWIQTFFGPGVELVVGNEGVQWDVLLKREHDLDNNDSDAAQKLGISADMEEVISWTPVERNLQLVDDSVATVYRANVGEAVVMLGNQWNEFRDALESKDGTITAKVEPVVHKSPEISTTQGRVLLTQDVIVGS